MRYDMLKLHSIIFWFISICMISFTNYLYAEDEVLIDSDEKAKEILLGSDWECKWKDAYFSGTNKVVYEQVSLKKVTAKVNSSYCPDGWGQYKGKIKKGRLVGKSSGFPQPCGAGSSDTYKAYKSSDGSYILKGSYKFFGGDIRGTSNCTTINK